MKSNVLLLVAAVVVVSVIVTLNQFFLFNYRAEMAQQFNNQQLMLAENISENIERKVVHIEGALASLSKIIGDATFQRSDLDRFVNDAFALDKDVIRDLRLFDNDGVLKLTSLGLPMDETDYAYIKIARILKDGDVFLIDRSAEQMLTFITPIGEYAKNGAAILHVSVEYINRKYLSVVKSGGRGYAWTMDGKGTLLYHPTQEKMVGTNLYNADASCFGCHKSFDVEKAILDIGAAGVQTYVAPYGEDKIIAFSKVELSADEFWIVCVSIPFSEVTASITTSIKLHSALVIAIFLATVVASVVMIAINKKRINAEEKVRHEKELEKYAAELEKAVEKRTMELISEKEKLFAIVEALDVGLFLSDHNKKIIWMNRALQDWFGGKEAVKGLTLDEIYAGKEISSTVDNMMIQEVIKHKIGDKTGYFQITSSPLVGPDGSMQLLGLIHDITELKEFETHMAHSEKLAALGSLTAGIAHEIGNPLTSVFSFLQILKEMESDKFKTESLETIIFHINRIAEIVKQMSGLSKLPPAELREVQVNELIDSSLGLIQYDKRAKAITVRKDLSSLPAIVTDGNQLAQVFMNLLLNAVDAMPEGGTLTLRSADTDGFITVDVEDTGAGIRPENLPKVFNPFFTTKDKGTGLGLSVSYNIIKSLGGEIYVRSEAGKGTTFTLKIPKEKH